MGKQRAATLADLAFETRREAGAGGDRVGEPLALGDEGAAALLGAQHALLDQRGDRGPHRVAVDAEALRQLSLGRQPPAIAERARRDADPDAVRDLPPERNPASPFDVC